jgi:predicted RNA-binding protein YlxR (DUF448 family)
VAPKGALRRLALDDPVDPADAVGAAHVVADPDGRRPGRGAYVCGAACARTAIGRRALPRAFRRAVTVDEHLVESMGADG